MPQQGDYIDIESLIDEIETIVNEGKTPAFGGGGTKKIIDAQDIYALLDEIRDCFPTEFNEARRIVRGRDDILAQAHQQAEAIIADAQQQAMILAGDQEVVRLAQLQADGIRDDAIQYDHDTRYAADEYVDQVLAQLEDNLKKVTAQISRGRQSLADSASSRNY